MIKIIIASLFVVFISVIANLGQTTSRDNTLVVGLEAAFAPFNWTETRPSNSSVPEEFKNHQINGSVSWFGRGRYANGYDVWVARRIAYDLGKELVIEQIVWDGLIPALQFGHIDVIIAGMTPTAVRAEIIDFSEEYHQVRNVLVARRDGRFADANSVDDLVGASFAVQRSTVFEFISPQIRDAIPGTTQLTLLESIPAVLSNLSAGANDITILSDVVARTIIEGDDPNFMILEIDYFEFEATPEYLGRLGIGVRQGCELLEPINASLRNFYRYLGEEHPYFDDYRDSPNFTFYASRRVRNMWMDKSITASLNSRK